MRRSILSNAFFSLISDLASRLATALVLIAITRRLGESASGVFTLSTNYVLLLSALASWGLDQLLIRDVAQDRGLATKHFGHFLLFRLVLSPFLWLLLATSLLWVRPYQPLTNWFIAVAGATIVGNSLWNLGQALLIAYERVWPASLISVVGGVLLVTGGMIALSSGAGMMSLALMLVVTSLLQATAVCIVAGRSLQWHRFRLDGLFVRRQLAAGLPFVPILLFIALETQVGSILLSFFRSETAVGHYGMANVIVTALAMLSQAVRVGIFPVMARLRQTDPLEFVRLYERSWRTLAAGSLPAVILLVVLAEPIMRLLYGHASPEAVTTLQCLAPIVCFYFLNLPNSRLMILEQRQGVMARWYAISTAVHIVLALVLIPGYAAPAVGVARAISMAVLFVQSCAYVERRILASRPWRFVWRPALACGAMAFVVFVVTPAWSPFARAASGLAVYGLVLALLAALAGNRSTHEPPGKLLVTWKASVAHPTLENHREQ